MMSNCMRSIEYIDQRTEILTYLHCYSDPEESIAHSSIKRFHFLEKSK